VARATGSESSAGEIRRLDHDSRLDIEFDIDLGAGREPGSYRLVLLRPNRSGRA